MEDHIETPAGSEEVREEMANRGDPGCRKIRGAETEEQPLGFM
jgi:hypothetical protein